MSNNQIQSLINAIKAVSSDEQPNRVNQLEASNDMNNPYDSLRRSLSANSNLAGGLTDLLLN